MSIFKCWLSIKVFNAWNILCLESLYNRQCKRKCSLSSWFKPHKQEGESTTCKEKRCASNLLQISCYQSETKWFSWTIYIYHMKWNHPCKVLNIIGADMIFCNRWTISFWTVYLWYNIVSCILQSSATEFIKYDHYIG